MVAGFLHQQVELAVLIFPDQYRISLDQPHESAHAAVLGDVPHQLAALGVDIQHHILAGKMRGNGAEAQTQTGYECLPYRGEHTHTREVPQQLDAGIQTALALDIAHETLGTDSEQCTRHLTSDIRLDNPGRIVI